MKTKIPSSGTVAKVSCMTWLRSTELVPKTKPYACRYGCDISYNDDSNRKCSREEDTWKLFTTVRGRKAKRKIELLGLDENSFTTGIM